MEEEKEGKEGIEITVHGKHVMILAVIGFVIVAGIVVSRRSQASEEGVASPVRDQVASSTTSKNSTALSGSSDGVNVTIEDIRYENGKTLVAIQMDNHKFDLSDPTIVDRSSIDGIVAESFNVLTNAMGGHHVTAEMTFDGDLNGELVIGVTEDVRVTFAI